ncbi:hypothetical protein J31TS4_13180 [Paenibacillus sp. J31TS4]|uniref:response regulator n=1 Tax=Paenibacillus sp. J31TS4 TaxID=2807195 RepID=UPI001B179F42|nr:response regulator [Paenibacillus sp. J31TS4]GIP38038.1 hypothetical protein J31TS4_13180 [Paenibacillus sp. J31TS4]
MLSLLIVDDELHVVERLSELLPWEEIGIGRVFKALSGGEALAILETETIDIVITDIRMPGMSGLELVSTIRDRWKMTKCILLSGHAEFGYAQEAIQHGTADYLLKPVSDEELLATVARQVEQLKSEWAELTSVRRLTSTFKEHLPLLRSNLLNELLQGRRMGEEQLREKLDVLEMPDLYGRSFALLLIRPEDPFQSADTRSRSLFDYAIGNMAEELFAPDYRLWTCRDSHDFLVFVVTREDGDGPAGDRDAAEAAGSGRSPESWQDALQRGAARLQDAVRTYLKGSVSVLVSRGGVFPSDMSRLYTSALSALRKQVGQEQGLFLPVGEEERPPQIQTIGSLYETPSLTHLLEAGRWQDTEERLQQIMAELDAKGAESEEHALEVYFTVTAAFSFIAHKNGRPLASILGEDYNRLSAGIPFQTLSQLKEWTGRVLRLLRSDMEKESRDTRTTIIRQVRQFVERNLDGDVSLQAIADHVYLHPVYLSKIYKLETGDNLSDYVQRLKMERAAFLLKESKDKIYEIAAQIGYQRAHSFIHVFKKHYGVTPQEYRDQHLRKRNEE